MNQVFIDYNETNRNLYLDYIKIFSHELENTADHVLKQIYRKRRFDCICAIWKRCCLFTDTGSTLHGIDLPSVSMIDYKHCVIYVCVENLTAPVQELINNAKQCITHEHEYRNTGFAFDDTPEYRIITRDFSDDPNVITIPRDTIVSIRQEAMSFEPVTPVQTDRNEDYVRQVLDLMQENDRMSFQIPSGTFMLDAIVQFMCLNSGSERMILVVPAVIVRDEVINKITQFFENVAVDEPDVNNDQFPGLDMEAIVNNIVVRATDIVISDDTTIVMFCDIYNEECVQNILDQCANKRVYTFGYYIAPVSIGDNVKTRVFDIDCQVDHLVTPFGIREHFVVPSQYDPVDDKDNANKWSNIDFIEYNHVTTLLLQYPEYRHVIVYCGTSIQVCSEMYNALVSYGISACIVHSEMNRNDRDNSIRLFNNGERRVIVTCRILSRVETSVNITITDTVIFFNDNNDTQLVRQCVNNVIQMYPTKMYGYVVILNGVPEHKGYKWNKLIQYMKKLLITEINDPNDDVHEVVEREVMEPNIQRGNIHGRNHVRTAHDISLLRNEYTDHVFRYTMNMKLIKSVPSYRCRYIRRCMNQWRRGDNDLRVVRTLYCICTHRIPKFVTRDDYITTIGQWQTYDVVVNECVWVITDGNPTNFKPFSKHGKRYGDPRKIPFRYDEYRNDSEHGPELVNIVCAFRSDNTDFKCTNIDVFKYTPSCHHCIHCVDCVDCVNCRNCAKCIDCVNCVNCINLHGNRM